MIRHELFQFAVDLCGEIPASVGEKPVICVVAPCGLLNSLSFEEFRCVKEYLGDMRRDVILTYDPSIRAA